MTRTSVAGLDVRFDFVPSSATNSDSSIKLPIRKLHVERPSVYLDQWVWIRLAQVLSGKSDNSNHKRALEKVLSASDAGVIFPISVTHYVETFKIRDGDRRRFLAAVMIRASKCRTLRARKDLLRSQMLNAMHEQFERPTFRPAPIAPFGVGVHFAFQGLQFNLDLLGSPEIVSRARRTFSPAVLCRMTQWAETQFLSGPRDADVKRLRDEYGYKPETTYTSSLKRLEWEQVYIDLLREDPIDADKLRVRVQAREAIHELAEITHSTLREYGLSFARAFRVESDPPSVTRPRIVGFYDAMPSVRIAVDMKAELFKDQSRRWKVNDLHDIDALSMAIPYCDVVVSDKAAVHSVKTTGADNRNGTVVTQKISDLIDLLPSLEGRATEMSGDSSGWDWLATGVGFNPLPPPERE